MYIDAFSAEQRLGWWRCTFNSKISIVLFFQEHVVKAASLRTPVLVASLALYSIWILIHIGADPAYRTLFVEEFHTGEAGRAHHLFGTWVGEGGRWQSFPTSMVASAMSAASYALFGESLIALRIPFVAASLISILLFAWACGRETRGQPLPVVLATAVFMLSPFLSALRPTSVNEVLLPLNGVLVILTLQAVGTQAGAPRSWMLAIVGLLAGGIAIIKADSAVLPLALAATIFIELLSRRLRGVDFAAFAAGGSASVVLYAAAVLLTFGWERWSDSIAFAREVLDHRQFLTSKKTLAPVVSVFLSMPKNMDLYVPANSFILVPSLALALAIYSKISLAGRFCVVFVLTLLFASAIFPLVYWKKATIAVVPLIFLHLTVATNLVAIPRANISKPLMRWSIILGAVFALLVAASPFRGMWAIQPFWSAKTWNAWPVWYSGAGAITVVALAVFVELRQLLLGLYAAVAIIVAVAGLHATATLPFRHDVEKIGRKIAAVIEHSEVVADHQGYRFAAPFSKAHFRFVHENDPSFPNAITASVRAHDPTFVLVTDAYKPLIEQVEATLPNYRKVLELSYVHPAQSFNEQDKTTQIVLFQKATLGTNPLPSAR